MERGNDELETSAETQAVIPEGPVLVTDCVKLSEPQGKE